MQDLPCHSGQQRCPGRAHAKPQDRPGFHLRHLWHWPQNPAEDSPAPEDPHRRKTIQGKPPTPCEKMPILAHATPLIAIARGPVFFNRYIRISL